MPFDTEKRQAGCKEGCNGVSTAAFVLRWQTHQTNRATSAQSSRAQRDAAKQGEHRGEWLANKESVNFLADRPRHVPVEGGNLRHRAPLESRFSKRRILKKALTQLRSKRCIKKM